MKAIIIHDNVFAYCDKLESVYVPNVTLIEGRAFSNCSRLTKVELGNILRAEDDIFRRTVTENISLTLSADQKKMENNGRWTPTSTDYKDSQDHRNCEFLGLRFRSIKCGDVTY